VFAYLLFPLLLSIAVAASRKTALALAVASIGLLAVIAHTGYGVNGPLDAYRNDNSTLPLLRCLAGFSLGLAAFRAIHMPVCKKLLAAEATPGAVLLFIGAALTLDKTDLLAVLAFPVLVAALYYNTRVSAGLFGNRLVHHFGEISYSLYLLHVLFLGVAGHYERVAEARFAISAPLVSLMAGVAATWLASWLSYRLIEVPGRRLLSPKIAI
jgi:peptidoglycan/LPS O-acetylase OafA/YrhL